MGRRDQGLADRLQLRPVRGRGHARIGEDGGDARQGLLGRERRTRTRELTGEPIRQRGVRRGEQGAHLLEVECHSLVFF